jgi:hypothetical protein
MNVVDSKVPSIFLFLFCNSYRFFFLNLAILKYFISIDAHLVFGHLKSYSPPILNLCLDHQL